MQTFLDRFHEQVLLDPERIAVRRGPIAITYGQLDILADSVALLLGARGVPVNARVGLLLRPGPYVPAVLIGLLRYGGVCVPIDVRIPPAGLSRLVDDTDIAAILVDSDNRSVISNVLNISIQDAVREPMSRPMPVVRSGSSSDDAFIFFTSGSEGRPKGVLMSESAVSQFIECLVELMDFSSTDVVLQFSSLAFISSVGQIFGTLACGATLVVRDWSWSHSQLIEEMERQGVNVLWITTSVLSELLRAERPMIFTAMNLRLLRVGGESLSPELVRRWFEISDTPILNVYGPTEAVQDVCAKLITSTTAEISIGRPLTGVEVYLEGCADGPEASGEIIVRSAGLATGYLDDPPLSAKRFFTSTDGEAVRSYRTGDRGAWTGEGDLKHLGRLDSQVKIRGYRIEPGEIEQRILEHSNTLACAVVLKSDGVHKGKLVAFVVSTLRKDLEKTLTEWCAEVLLPYMVPRIFFPIDNLPLNLNGKIDRGRLAAEY